MAWTASPIVQTTFAAFSGPVSASGIDTSTADTLVVHIVYQNGSVNFGGSDTLTDNKSNAAGGWQFGTPSPAGGNLVSQLAWFKNANVGANHILTINIGSTTIFSGQFVAFKGGHLSSIFVGGEENKARTASGTTIQPGSVTPSFDSCLILCGFGGGSGHGTPTIDVPGGFTIIGTPVAFVGGGNYGSALAYLIQTTPAAANPTWTASSAELASTIAVLKAASSSSGGGGGSAKPAMHYYRLIGAPNV